jgi:carbon-monoxide dehydrogenase small subunit
MPPEARERIEIAVTVNGAAVRRSVAARQHLADFLREELGLTGTHLGCEHGVCGTCTVRLNGEIVRGCLVLAVQADGSSVDTIEGLAGDANVAALQRTFHEHNAAQCGYCTPGMIIAAAELLERADAPDRESIRAHLAGNYCRCTGYQAIVDAVAAVCRERCTEGRS